MEDITLEQAVELLLARSPQPQREEVPLMAALGRLWRRTYGLPLIIRPLTVLPWMAMHSARLIRRGRLQSSRQGSGSRERNAPAISTLPG